jgi:hypothetical protein
VLDELPNTFDELNRVRCFNHTIQLSAKGLLKPFYSVRSIETDNETEYGDDSVLSLQALDDEEKSEGEGEDDPNADNDDKDEDEDPLGALDDDEREELINNTKAVCTTLNKVCLSPFSITFFGLRTHKRCYYRYGNSPSPSSIPPP